MRIKLVYFVIQINLKKFDPRKYIQNMIEIIKVYFNQILYLELFWFAFWVIWNRNDSKYAMYINILQKQ